MPKKEDDIFARLNQEQLDAVKNTEGHIRVLAGAGSGKTRALVSRYVYLVRDLGISPKNILCVTFTNRAAEEMKMRVRRELGDLDLGYICTFHAFCALLLHEDINKINFPKDFVVLDKEDWRSMLLRIFADMGLTLKEATIQQKIDEVLEAKKLQADTYIDYFYKLNNDELIVGLANDSDKKMLAATRPILVPKTSHRHKLRAFVVGGRLLSNDSVF